MFYDIPATMKKEEAPQWPEGVGSIQATLPDGMAVEVPVLKGTNVLTLGVVGTEKQNLLQKTRQTYCCPVILI